MYAEEFTYHRAESVAEAIDLLETQPEAKLLAGGQALIPAMKKREMTPETVVDIGNLEKLCGIHPTDGGVRIGALTTHSEVQKSTLLDRLVPVIPDTAAHITGGSQVHNFATIGGNIARAHPGYDHEGALLATNSEISVRGPDGTRRVPAREFFHGACTTDLAEEQLITGVHVPSGTGDRYGGYAKRKEPASGNAIVGVATDLTTGDDETVVTSARLAVNGLQPSAVRLEAAEKVLVNATLSDATIDDAVAAAGDSLDPDRMLDNKKASAEYRRTLLGPQVRKSISRATAPLSV